MNDNKGYLQREMHEQLVLFEKNLFVEMLLDFTIDSILYLSP